MDEEATEAARTELAQHWVYRHGIPVLCAVCTVSVIVNASVLWRAKHVRRPLTATLRISLSLAAADALASTLLCVGLLANSYAPIVWNVEPPVCVMLAMEALRLGAIFIAILHLLALACNHHVGIARPLHYARIVTRRHVCACLSVLWTVPPLYFLAYFALVPGEGLTQPGCPYTFLLRLRFRIIFVALLVAPLVLMCAIYTHILVIVRRHRRNCSIRHHQRQRQAMARNVRAVHTTLLILGSFVAGLLPATGALLICCEECVLQACRSEFLWFVNLLVIIKTLANPIIYAARMAEIREAARRVRPPAATPDTSHRLRESSWRTSARTAICHLASNDLSSTHQHSTPL